MDLQLAGKVAIVTGGGWGMGKASALTFAEEGVHVTVAELDEEKGNQTVKQITDKGQKAIFVKTDVTSREDCQRMAKRTFDEFGKIDILVNVVGAWGTDTFMKSGKETWDKEIAVNLYGMIYGVRAVLEYMIPQKSGSIITVGSDAGRVGEANMPTYSAVKAGQIGLTKALAKDLGKHNIRVNEVCPGTTIGERRLQMEAEIKAKGGKEWDDYQEMFRKMLRSYPLHKLGVPQDTANMIVFVASDRAGHVTGQTISVNGGYCMP